MPKVKRNNLQRVAPHVGFWFISLVFTLLLFYYNENRVHFDLVVLSKAAITNVGFAIAVYVSLLILIPRFLIRINYLFYVFWLIVLHTFSSLFIRFLLSFPLRNLLDVGIRFSSFDIRLHAAFFSANLIYVALTSFLKF